MIGKILQLLGIKKDRGDHPESRCVLIVEDNKADLLLVKRTVEKMGHRALTAENGKIGYELARTKKPDLIVSDCRMPEMDGIEMCKLIKADPETRKIPFVFLTSVDSPNTVIGCFDMGVDNYICKPVNPALLADQITAVFKERLTSGT